MIGEFPGACAISRFLNFHRWKRFEATAQCLPDRSAGGRYQFDLRSGGIYRRATQQFQRRGRGDRKGSVGALDRATTDVERRTNPFVDCQRLGSHRSTDDIGHGIDGADFVKMHLLDRCFVNFGFGCAESFEDSNGCCFGGAADRSLFYNPPYLGEAASMGVAMWGGSRLCGNG